MCPDQGKGEVLCVHTKCYSVIERKETEGWFLPASDSAGDTLAVSQ